MRTFVLCEYDASTGRRQGSTTERNRLKPKIRDTNLWTFVRTRYFLQHHMPHSPWWVLCRKHASLISQKTTQVFTSLKSIWNIAHRCRFFLCWDCQVQMTWQKFPARCQQEFLQQRVSMPRSVKSNIQNDVHDTWPKGLYLSISLWCELFFSIRSSLKWSATGPSSRFCQRSHVREQSGA